MVNLAEDPSYAEIKKELVGKMWRFAAKENDTSSSTPTAPSVLHHGGLTEGLKS
ncbi:MAG: hypothetical protein R2856_05235 [Caldilineaceae bacterium]